MIINRRKLLGGSAAALAVAGLPRISFAAQSGTAKRLVFILQRGAADGLGILAPVGDPSYSTLRGMLAEDYAEAPQIGGLFALHPALINSAKMYADGEMMAVHAVASGYRDRSHFDGQNIIESGGLRPYERKDGWLNRLLGLLPEGENSGLAISQNIPLALQGQNKSGSYAPSRLPDAADDYMRRIGHLYMGDERLHMLWEESVATRTVAESMGGAGNMRQSAEVGALAARLLTAKDGAQVAMIETTGWDTHNGQRQRLGRELGNLDTLISSLRRGLGTVWNDTLVVVATEFGRTAAVNGTNGTDHGTASTTLLYGGTLNGGTVLGDWPGLRQNDLYQGRDLKPTSALETVIATSCATHFNLDPELTKRTLYPDLQLR
ncbi:DUF1501 domain-containing protein [Altererythrobacter ishigakiensis]|uniref:Uncharacterized protein (DUF1501 family) n=1 Tax=Altererythrobacter ishigakiensis TaxID=476157 RepID=A0A562UM44_9SPHN|nr:DUF1501 domain-containing protein [Altererythrobacter ishigakiensis]TWJ06684.1 uncharacterized protein (DUF1501 family) [Altererythrobacter ishigakiensis]